MNKMQSNMEFHLPIPQIESVNCITFTRNDVALRPPEIR